ncbi:UNVERIFIED_CONTAM: Syntaxin-binding protein 5 [Gekko kuhli]
MQNFLCFQWQFLFLNEINDSFGRPGVECYCQHDSGAAVIQLQFLINEGALVSALADDTLHLWNLRQKRPAILHSLKFNRER